MKKTKGNRLRTNHLGLLVKAQTSQVVPLEMVKQLSEDDDPMPMKGFGLWKDKPVDGLEYQERIREEWEH